MKVYQLTKQSHWDFEPVGMALYESKADALSEAKQKNSRAVSATYGVRTVNVKPAKDKP